MMENDVTYFETVESFCNYNNQGIQHPLIQLIDFSLSIPKPRQWIKVGFFLIIFKDIKCGDLSYGNTQYDYDDGTFIFFAPEQVYKMENVGKIGAAQGLGLAFHQDLIAGKNLEHNMFKYNFFSYNHNEALHVSDEEKSILLELFSKIKNEINNTFDSYSKDIICKQIEVFLDYCSRYYERQYRDRQYLNQSVYESFYARLVDYYNSAKPTSIGFPLVSYFAEELKLSPNYLGDVVKKETGISPQEIIHQYIIGEAKMQLKNINKPIREISFSLGFKYPSHFTRFFKQKEGQSPVEFRKQY